MKKILAAVLFVIFCVSLFGCNADDLKDAITGEDAVTLTTAEKIGTNGKFDIYKLTYSDGFETTVEIGDNSVVEDVRVVNGALVYTISGLFTAVFDTIDMNNIQISGITGSTNIQGGEASDSGIKLESSGNIVISSNGNVGNVAMASAFRTAPVPRCDHKFGDYTKKTDSTCSAVGIDEAKCTECGFVLFYYNAMLEHTLDTTTLKEHLSCHKESYTYYECTVCGAHDKVDSIKSPDHQYDSDGVCTECGAKVGN